MSLPTAILETILARLAQLFLTGANNDPVAAREAAHQLLLAYHPETETEFALAAEIISFSFHALDVLSQSADPTLSPTRQLRLRGSAVSLSREAHKAERKLAQLQKAARINHPAEPRPLTPHPEMSHPETPPPEPAPVAAEPARIVLAGKPAAQTWTQAYNQRQRDRRVAKLLQKRQAAQTHLAAGAAPDLALTD